MSIAELINRKSQLERDMEAAISKLLKEFHEEVGLTPSSISVDMHPVSTLVDPHTFYCLTRVQCDLTI
jgi:hypothetical protein